MQIERFGDEDAVASAVQTSREFESFGKATECEQDIHRLSVLAMIGENRDVTAALSGSIESFLALNRSLRTMTPYVDD